MRFFIIGTGRCGTTLLHRMMNLHPELFVFAETHWIPKMYEYFGTAPVETHALLDIVKRTRFVTGERTTEIDESRFKEFSNNLPKMTVYEFCNSVGQMFAAEFGKEIWADKTPDYGYFLATLQSLWPDCRFIHLIRDGVAVTKSMYGHIGYQALVEMRHLFWCPVSFDYSSKRNIEKILDPEGFVELWQRRMIRTKNEATRLQNGTYLELRYEDLLRTPETQLAAISSFVELTSPQSWIKEAAALIRPEKLSSPRPTEMLIYFNTAQKLLLEELGYSAYHNL